MPRDRRPQAIKVSRLSSPRRAATSRHSALGELRAGVDDDCTTSLPRRISTSGTAPLDFFASSSPSDAAWIVLLRAVPISA